MTKRVPVVSLVLALALPGCQDFAGPDRLEKTARSHPRAASQAVPDQFIVALRADVDPGAVADEIASIRGGRVLFVYRHALNGFALRVPAAAADGIARDPRVLFVEPDLPVRAIAQTLPTGVNRIDADLNATADIDGADDVRVDVDVAILDTGIDLDHPDLNVASGKNCMDETVPPDDGNSHGTHVAGTVGALDNDIGVVGVAPGARLWPVKVLSDAGSGTIATVICGIDFVTANAGALEVANMSLGAQGQSDALRTALQNSVAAGVYYAVAAGNDGNDIYGQDGTFGTSDDFIPAAYPEVAAVSAMADYDGAAGGNGGTIIFLGCGRVPDDTFICFTNFSASVVSDNPVSSPGKAIDVAAPGTLILSTVNGGGTGTKSGTSMAAPHVAGAAALHIAANGRASDAAGVAAIRQALIDSGQPQSEWRGGASAGDPDGNLEPLVYVANFTPPAPVTDVAVTDVSAPGSVVQGDPVSVDVTVKNVGNQDVGSFDVTLTDDTDAVTIGTQTIGELAAGASATLTFSWSTTESTSLGDHTLTASHDFADDNTGNNSNSTSVTLETAVTDIAITAVSAPPSAVQGDVVSVSVTVENVGNRDVASGITVTLAETDGTTIATIGTQTISGLAADASTTLTFSWNTAGASLGHHTLTATHDFADDNASNNSNSTVVDVTDMASTLHVGDLDGASTSQGSTWTATVTITVHDGLHDPLAEATVSGSFNGAVTGTGSCTTNGSGQCTVTLSGIHKRFGSVTFTVDNVTHGSLAYDATSNHDPDGDSSGTSITVAKP